MRLQIKVSDDGIIEDAKFKTFGCGSAIASSSLATEWVKGKTRRPGDGDQEHADRRGAQPAAGEDPLLGAGRGRDQERDRRLQGEAAERRQRGTSAGQTDEMAIAVSDRAVAEIKKAAGQRATRPRGCASASAAAAARAFPTCSSGRTASRAPEDKVLAFEDGAVRVFVDPKSFVYPRRLDAGVRDHDDGPRLQVHEPERERDLRLRRERPVLGAS